MTFQPNPLSAMGMVAQDPIRLVDGRKATCDGGEEVYLAALYGEMGSNSITI